MQFYWLFFNIYSWYQFHFCIIYFVNIVIPVLIEWIRPSVNWSDPFWLISGIHIIKLLLVYIHLQYDGNLWPSSTCLPSRSTRCQYRFFFLLEFTFQVLIFLLGLIFLIFNFYVSCIFFRFAIFVCRCLYSRSIKIKGLKRIWITRFRRFLFFLLLFCRYFYLLSVKQVFV